MTAGAPEVAAFCVFQIEEHTMVKYPYCVHEAKTAEKKAWSVAAATWNEYQAKEKVGICMLLTVITACVFIAIGMNSLSVDLATKMTYVTNIPLAILGFFGSVGTLIGGSILGNVRAQRARKAFEKDCPEMAKLVR